MGNYAIGRDLQELRNRIEMLELACGQRGQPARGAGTIAKQQMSQGVDPNQRPVHWKPAPDQHIPPFINGLLGFHHKTAIAAAEAKIWSCQPEPLKFYVNWYAGGTDEFYRLQDQSFMIVSATDPNTNITKCTATYTATLIASRKAKLHFSRDSHEPGSALYFNIYLMRNQSVLKVLPTTDYYAVMNCDDHYLFSEARDFDPALFDLVTGATWNVSGIEYVDRC